LERARVIQMQAGLSGADTLRGHLAGAREAGTMGRRQLQTHLTPRLQAPWAQEPVFHTVPCILRSGAPETLVCIEVHARETLHSLTTGGTYVRFGQNRHYRKPGVLADESLFSNHPGNELD
jgi:hypothetical protein